MNQDLVTQQSQGVISQIDINWPVLLEQRPAILAHHEVPAYLVLPEIHQLLDQVLHENTLLMLQTLWHTGARISECLALTPASFTLDVRQPYVSVQTLKRRGRPSKKGNVKPRLLPLSDVHYIRTLERYIKTHQIHKTQRLFPITRSATNKRVERLVERLPYQPSIHITPHTFRHSFAVNAVLYGTPLNVIQGWLGHKDIQSTKVYTQVLSLETHHLMARMQF